MKRQHINLIVTVILVAGLVGVIWHINRPEPVKVFAIKAERGTVEQTVVNTRAGTVNACRRARLSPNSGGQISLLRVREGDLVEAGELLLEIWNKDTQAEISLNQSQVMAAISNARAICLQADVAQREAARLKRLQQKGAISEESLDKAATDAKSRLADCESANATYRVSQARLGLFQAQLERTRLTAPFDGVVAEVNGELNEYVTPSPPGIPTPPVIDLIDNSCFFVSAPIDEVDAPRIKKGMSARVTLDAFGDQSFPSSVRRIAPYILAVEKQSRTVEVELDFSQPEVIEQMLAGYSADVEIILETRQDSLRIPTEAVMDDDHVMVFLPDRNILEKRRIQIGLSNWDHTEVIAGLSAGDQVVTSLDRDGVTDGAQAQLDSEQ